ncbi:short chain dehydrogenase family protein (plasmid) [Burkholderia pseudomallei]|uniref:Short chain dehydrogenase family protein n=1 Tax=Burkholderia pseudomallei TaxID=28450 RepID=A0AA40JIK3_BURPE|nr:SDR family oxidoreductase [Burkholderia pseudomallei]AIV73891.1 short chain dehydrogenase family protein [Burkholderia pseudomallei]KGS72506.1 short chain dehydrogenase family protein [Burkholderia pseudomallei MSHR5596]KGW78450.1 short chain dehydrogenase family protein [Burkholderia pseudomallei MSHR2990]KGX17135.1 short chain dehydrogenase family protein [Burkholderia pseudomallei]
MNALSAAEREFEGKVAIVVGGSSGIGFHAAVLLAQRGAHVMILADRGVDDAIELAAGRGVQLRGVTGDAASSALMKQVIDRLAQERNGLHIVVHTAAIHPYGNAGDTPEEVWDRVMAVNLKSVFLLAHHALPHMIRQRDGAIVNVSSIQGSGCQRDVSAYSTSKAAILGFTRTLAVDYSSMGVRANSVSPGSIRTPLLDLAADKFGAGQSKEEVFKSWGGVIPAGRIGEPEEVAEVIAFAASPRASYCSGSDFVVDGALRIKLN